MQGKGIKVKELDSFPALLEIDEFFLELRASCKTVSDIVAICKLYQFSNSETLEIIKTITLIRN